MEKETYLKKFFDRNLDSANKSDNIHYQDNMAIYVAYTSKSMGELEKILTGVQDLKKHVHHPVRHLVNSSIQGFKYIVQVRREIEANRNKDSLKDDPQA